MGLQKRIYMARPIPTIMPGTRYGHLVTTGIYIPYSKDGKKRIYGKVECICDCGNISLKPLINLKCGNTKSCSPQCRYFVSITHGLSADENGKNTKEYNAWSQMKERCDNPKNISYPYTGGKGITYHESLSTIEGFWDVMGKAPSKYHRFTRIDKDGDYEPGNVHWYLSSKWKGN